MKQPKVVEKKLGRQRAFGQAFTDDNLIEIDPRQNSKEYIGTLIHEWLHVEYPDWTEKVVSAKSNKLTNFLWKHRVRILRK